MSTTKTAPKSKPRLGRGLSSLISISEVPVQIELSETEDSADSFAASVAARPPALSTASTPAVAARIASHVAPPSAAKSPNEPNIRKPSSGDSITKPNGESAGPDNLNAIRHLPLLSIVPNPHQPRQNFDDATLAELADSIKSTGLIQPVIVRQIGTHGNQFELIAGERRLRAAKLAGLKTLPAIVREVDAVTQAQMALVENIQRQDLNPMDRATGYRTLIDQLGLTQSELAIRLGEDRSSIANFLRLLDLAEPVKKLVRDGKLSLGHAKLIASAPDILEQERLANLVMLQGLSVRNLERLIQQGPAKQNEPKPAAATSAHIPELEKTLSRQLGLRVQVRTATKKGKGRLVLHYATLEQFDELLIRLGCRPE